MLIHASEATVFRYFRAKQDVVLRPKPGSPRAWLVGLGGQSRLKRVALVDESCQGCLCDGWASVGGLRMVAVSAIMAAHLAAVSRTGRYLRAGGDGGGSMDYFWV